MAASGAARRASSFKTEADELFKAGDYTAAQAEIANLRAMEFSFLDIADSADFEARPVTICIVAYRDSPDLRVLLDAIGPLSADPAFGFCLVSNAAADVFAGCTKPACTRSVKTGSNLGASLGRNAAIHCTVSDYIIFIDDDGLTSPDCVRSLVATAKAHDATAVRGRVVPKTSFLEIPWHYDRGDFIIPHYMDIEGMTLWRMSALALEDFDPLLYGHEGVDLTTRLYPYYGPNAFLYDPDAILLHDYGHASSKGAEKIARMQRNDLYLAKIRPELPDVKKVFRSYETTELARHALAVRRGLVALPKPRAPATEVTVLTTCRNGASFIPAYAMAWKRQTDRRFRIVLVDDGSTDGSAQVALQAFEEFEGFTLVNSPPIGRAAALNLGLQHVETDIVLIADIDDIPIPQRIDWTRSAYEGDPELQAVGFGIFTGKAAVREQSPYGIAPTALEHRALLGMPMPFPAFSFRKSAMIEGFAPELAAGVDCDWLLRSLAGRRINGRFFPTSAVFYAVHDGQITASKADVQKRVKLERTKAYHLSILGPDAVAGEDHVAWFTGIESPPATGLADLDRYAGRLSTALIAHAPREAPHAVLEVYRTIKQRAAFGQPKAGQRLPRLGGKYRRIAVIGLGLYLVALAAGLWVLLAG